MGTTLGANPGTGKSLLQPTQGLVDWAKANWERVRKAQDKYDSE